MPQTTKEGLFKWFLVVEDEGSTNNDIEHYLFFPALVDELIRKNEEQARQGHDVPGLSFYTVVQPIIRGKNIINDQSWSFKKIGKPEKTKGTLSDVKSGQPVFRGNPCKNCGEQEWQTTPPDPKIKFLCGECNK